MTERGGANHGIAFASWSVTWSDWADAWVESLHRHRVCGIQNTVAMAIMQPHERLLRWVQTQGLSVRDTPLETVLARLEQEGVPSGQWSDADVGAVRAQWELYRTVVPRVNADVLRGLNCGEAFVTAWEKTRTLVNLYPATRAPEGTHAIHTMSNNLFWPPLRDDPFVRHLHERTPFLATSGIEDMRAGVRVAEAHKAGARALQCLTPSLELAAVVRHHVARGWSVALQRGLQLREEALCRLGQRLQRVDASLAVTTVGLALAILLPALNTKDLHATWNRWKAQLPCATDARGSPVTYLNKCRDAYSKHTSAVLAEIRAEMAHWTAESAPCWVALLDAAGVYDCRRRALQSMQKLWADSTRSMLCPDLDHPDVTRVLQQAEAKVQDSERNLAVAHQKATDAAGPVRWALAWDAALQKWRNAEGVASLLAFLDQTWGSKDRLQWKDIEACPGPLSQDDAVLRQTTRVSLLKRLLEPPASIVPDACTAVWRAEAAAWSAQRREFLEVAHDSLVQRQNQLRDLRTEAAAQPLVLLVREEKVPKAMARAWATCKPLDEDTERCAAKCMPHLDPLRRQAHALLLRLGEHMHELVARFPDNTPAMLSRLRRFVHGNAPFQTTNDVYCAAHEWSVLCVYANLLGNVQPVQNQR